MPGVIEASVNFATNTLTVSYEKDQLTPGEIRAAVLAAGYDLIVEEAHKEERREEEQQMRYTRLKWKVIGAWILVVPLLVFSMILMHVPYSNEIQMLLAIPVMVFLEVVSLPGLGNRLNWDGAIWIHWLHLVLPLLFCSVCSILFPRILVCSRIGTARLL